MILVPCAYWDCSSRRPHYESDSFRRPHRYIEVSDNFDILSDRAYCSIECMCYDGVPIVSTKDSKSKIEQRHSYVDPRNTYGN